MLYYYHYCYMIGLPHRLHSVYSLYTTAQLLLINRLRKVICAVFIGHLCKTQFTPPTRRHYRPCRRVSLEFSLVSQCEIITADKLNYDNFRQIWSQIWILDMLRFYAIESLPCGHRMSWPSSQLRIANGIELQHDTCMTLYVCKHWTDWRLLFFTNLSCLSAYSLYSILRWRHCRHLSQYLWLAKQPRILQTGSRLHADGTQLDFDVGK